MSTRSFYFALCVTILVCLGMTAALVQVLPQLWNHQTFITLTNLVFAGLAIAVWHIALPVANAQNKARLTQFTLLATGARMMVSVSLLMVYQFAVRPADRSYIYAFLIAYLVYTVCETYALVRLGRATA